MTHYAHENSHNTTSITIPTGARQSGSYDRNEHLDMAGYAYSGAVPCRVPRVCVVSWSFVVSSGS